MNAENTTGYPVSMQGEEYHGVLNVSAGIIVPLTPESAYHCPPACMSVPRNAVCSKAPVTGDCVAVTDNVRDGQKGWFFQNKCQKISRNVKYELKRGGPDMGISASTRLCKPGERSKSLKNYNSMAAQPSNINSMKFPWNIQKKKTDATTQPVPDKPKCEFLDITARYFMLDKGCPGDTKTLVKFDGSYCRWISQDKRWIIDPTITNEDWKNGCLRGIPRDEAERILNS